MENMRKIVLIKNALHDRSVFQSPIGPMPRSTLTPPCPIAYEHKRSQTPPPSSRTRQVKPLKPSTNSPPMSSRSIPPPSNNSPTASEKHASCRAVHQPVRFNSPPPCTSSFMVDIVHPHPRPLTIVIPSCSAAAGRSISTPPIARSKCPCCC